MFPNEEYMKTAFNGVSKQLGNIKKNIARSDWQQNDPTAPDYIKNRVGGYDVNGGEAMAQSGDAVTIVKNDIYARKIGSDTQYLHGALTSKDFVYAFMDNAKDEFKNIILGSSWVITDDYAYLDSGDGMPVIFALFAEASIPLEGFNQIREPGVYILVLKNDGYEPFIIKGISWGKIVKIPQKYLPDPEPKDTLVVKFTLTNSPTCKADHTGLEIHNAYKSGKVFIKGALASDDHSSVEIDGPCEVNDDGIFFTFQLNGLTVYIAMAHDNVGYVFIDATMFHFESDSRFSLKVTTPGWDGKIYAWGQEWNGSQIQSAYFDGKYRLYLYGVGNGKLTGVGNNGEFVLTGSDIHAKGSIEALRDVNGNTNMLGYCYANLFKNATSLVEAPELPATTLASGCYDSMFDGCTSLVEAPELPATTLASGCYDSMFDGCTSLVKVPKLPATTLATRCYGYMFCRCTSLVETPELPATTLMEQCYNRMFFGCTSLVKVPKLPATTLTTECYSSMFNKCTSLKLSATETDDYCIPYRIPSSGTGVDATLACSSMFANTGTKFTETPTINTTYYLHKSCGIVGMTDDPKPVPKTDEMTQPVGMDKWTGELFTKPSGGGGGASIDLGITGSTVGQVAKVKTVDNAGKPTEWEAASIEKGDDGYSPTAKVEATADGAKITITDKTGTTEATVKHGKDGTDGAPGKDGADGAPGKDGTDGANGITPTIGDNGNWYLGTVDTGKPSRGAKGDKGDTGADGKDGAGMDITGATVGQIAKITAVDMDGKPTAWEPVDMPSGSGGEVWEKVADITLEEQVNSIRVTFSACSAVYVQFQWGGIEDDLGNIDIAPNCNDTLNYGEHRASAAYVTTSTKAKHGYTFIRIDTRVGSVWTATSSTLSRADGSFGEITPDALMNCDIGVPNNFGISMMWPFYFTIKNEPLSNGIHSITAFGAGMAVGTTLKVWGIKK